MHSEIPESERDYYIACLVRLKVELRKTKTEQEFDKIVKKFEKLQKELEQKYGNTFKRYAQ